MSILSRVTSKLSSVWQKKQGEALDVSDTSNVVSIKLPLLQAKFAQLEEKVDSLSVYCPYRNDNLLNNVSELVQENVDDFQNDQSLNDRLRDLLVSVFTHIKEERDNAELMISLREMPSLLKRFEFQDGDGKTVKFASFVCAMTAPSTRNGGMRVAEMEDEYAADLEDESLDSIRSVGSDAYMPESAAAAPSL